MKDSAENNFGKDLEDLTLDDVKTAIKDEFSSDTELNEEDLSFWDKWKQDKADIGNKEGSHELVSWDRPFQKIMEIIQLIFGVNLMSFGQLGSWLQSFVSASPNSWVTHLIVSVIAIIVINFIREIVAIKNNKLKSDNKK